MRELRPAKCFVKEHNLSWLKKKRKKKLSSLQIRNVVKLQIVDPILYLHYVIHVETQRFSKTTKKWHFEDSKYPVPVYTAHPRFLIFADGKKVRRIHGDLRYFYLSIYLEIAPIDWHAAIHKVAQWLVSRYYWLKHVCRFPLMTWGIVQQYTVDRLPAIKATALVISVEISDNPYSNTELMPLWL